MKVAQIGGFRFFGVRKILNKKSDCDNYYLPKKENCPHDSVSFGASTAYYLKKYNTLPDEIKNILDPKDAIDMFKDLDYMKSSFDRKNKKQKTDFNDSYVAQYYDTPWLKDYYVLILSKPDNTLNGVWTDDDKNIQIFKKSFCD